MSHAHLSSDSLDKLSLDPRNKVLRWAQPGDKRQDALGAPALLSLINALTHRVIDYKRSRPDANEFMLRYHLSQERPSSSASDSSHGISTWGEFAQFYPTFWGKLTSAATTRKDVITIHMMIDARLDLEKGVLSSEEEVETRIQSDLVALNIRRDEHGGGGGGRGSAETRELMEKARLRRLWLEKRFTHVVVPTEELKKMGIDYEPSRCVLDDIVSMYEKLDKKLATPEGKNARAAEVSRVPPTVMLFGRNMLEFRAGIAKKCMGLPEPLDPKGHNFMPTYTRSAQLDLEWQDAWGQ